MLHYIVQGVQSQQLNSVQGGILYFRIPLSGKLKRVDVYSGATNISGAAVFDVNVGPSPGSVITIFSDPSARPQIATGQLSGSATGLSVAVTAGWIGTVDLDSVAAGGVGLPFFIVITLDDELSIEPAVTTKTAAYTAAAGDDIIFLDPTAGAFPLTLMLAASRTRPLYVKNIAALGGNVATVDADGAETINGASTLELPAGEAVRLIPRAAGAWETI